MNKSDVPQVSYAWWKENQPKTLPSTGLGEALKKFDDLYAAAKKVTDLEKFEEALDLYAEALKALDDLEPAVQRAIGKCQPVVHAATKTVLAKYPAEIKKKHTEVVDARKRFGGRLDHKVDDVVADCQKVIAAAKDAIATLEKKMHEIEAVEHEAAENRDTVVHAMAAGDLEDIDVEIAAADSYANGGKALRDEIHKITDNAVRTLSAQWKKSYNSKLADASDRLKGTGNLYFNVVTPLDVTRERADEHFAAIQHAAESVKKISVKVGEVEDHFVAVCEGLFKRVGPQTDRLDAQIRQIGGFFDQAVMNAISYRESKDKGAPDHSLLDTSKSNLKQGILEQAELSKALPVAKASFEAAMAKFPPFVTEKDKRFTHVLQDLDTLAKEFARLEKEKDKLTDKAKKSHKSYDEATA